MLARAASPRNRRACLGDLLDPLESLADARFRFDTLANGRTLKMLNVIDEFTPEALAIEVDQSIDANQVVTVLDRLAIARSGAPVYVPF